MIVGFSVRCEPPSGGCNIRTSNTFCACCVGRSKIVGNLLSDSTQKIAGCPRSASYKRNGTVGNAYTGIPVGVGLDACVDFN